MKKSLALHYRFILLVSGIFCVFLFLLFGTTNALPQPESESAPTAEFLAGTIVTPTAFSPSNSNATITTTENVNGRTLQNHFENETVALESNTTTTTTSLPIVNITGPVPFLSEAISSPSPSSPSSPSPSPSSETPKPTKLPTTSIPPTINSTIPAKAALTGEQSLKQIIGNGDTLPKNNQYPKENGRSLSFPQNHSSNRLSIKENKEKNSNDKSEQSKLPNLTVKSTPSPISVQDKRIQMIWGGTCTYAIWNVCNRIKSWGGDYLVPDKNDPEKMIKKYYRIDCVEKPETTFCLRNGWTVARCHMLCMSQCNVDFKINFDKVVSYDGECRWPILGRK
ncbi:unnamed protein product [Orchesella dallaii]|uniref:Uncharacterized protein n=1 Tax=Orchesella dallaii TaxID=48710 RepID=A0ABP1PHI4_9HEXA